MADIAEIGFKANTSDLVDAKAKLEAISPAAGKAEKSSEKLSTSFDGLNAAASKLMAAANGLISASEKLSSVTVAAAGANTKEANAVNDAANANSRKAKVVTTAAAATEKATAASEAAAAAAKKEAAAVDAATAARGRSGRVPLMPRDNFVSPWAGNGPAAAGGGGMTGANDNVAKSFNVGNVAAQFQDIGVTAAMGMNPLLIALQQGTQLSMAFQQAGKGLGATLVSAFASIVSPLSLVTIGLVALTAAGLQLVNWTSVAQFVLNAIADILPSVAAGVVAVGAALTLAFAPSILAMITSIAIAIAAGLVSAIGLLVATVGAIPLAIGLIIADLIIFRDAWTKTLGVDLVGAAKTGINYVIGSFVAAYHGIEFVWKNFPNIIGAAAVGAANMAIKAVNAIISASIAGLNALVRAVNSLITLGPVGKALGVSGPIGEIGDFAISEMANGAADALAGAVRDRNKQLQEDLSKDYLGAIGGAITEAATTAAGKIREFSNGLDDEKSKKKKGGGKTEAQKFEDIVNGAERSIASLQAERDAIGLSEEATARLKYETQLLNEAKQKNIDLSPAQRETLMGLANDMASLEVETSKAREALDFSKGVFKGFLSDLRNGLKEGKGFWESFGDAINNVLDKVIDKLLNNFIDAIFEVNSAAGSGGKGGGGFLGGIFSWIGGLFSAKGNAFGPAGHLDAFAKGGSFTNGVVSRPTLFTYAKGGAFGVMGEAGPEAVMPLTRGADGSLGVQMYGGDAGGGSQTNMMHVQNTFSLDGAISSDDVKQMVRQGMDEAVDIAKHKLPEWNHTFGSDGAFS